MFWSQFGTRFNLFISFKDLFMPSITSFYAMASLVGST
jgi:hypothetical protein